MIFIVRQLALVERENNVICITQNKGGAGKTSLLTNLSGVIMKDGDRQLIIDTDGQGNMGRGYGLKKNNRTSYELFTGQLSVSEVTHKYNKQLDIIQSGIEMNNIELNMLPRMSRYDDPFNMLKPHIDDIRHKYDYIMIDTPPSMGLVTGNVMAAADYAIIPFVPEPFCEESLMNVISAVKDFQAAGHSIEILAVVPMLVISNTTLHNQMIADARRYCVENNIYMTDTVIPRSIKFPTATAYENVPATIGRDHKNVIIQSYYKLWDEIKVLIKERAK